MSNKINKLTTAELGSLFPIILEESKPEWFDYYVEEEKRIFDAIGVYIFRIHHFGSTSVPGLLAKPTIDILVEIALNSNEEKIIDAMQNAGFLYSEKQENPAPHMMFMKGYAETGFVGQAVHVHVRFPGDWDELYFCEYLRRHPEIHKEYEQLKIELKKHFEKDREAYTNGKSSFIERITALARHELHPHFSISGASCFQTK